MPSVFRPPALVRAVLESQFPNLVNSHWFIKSPFNDGYQCIAWALCRTDRKWGPRPIEDGFYWPPDAPFDDSVASYIHVFAAFGYKRCNDLNFEFGYQKVAIYVGIEGVRHIARQEFFGRGWLSKIGKQEDILHHDLASLEGDPALTAFLSYGRIGQILKRSWWSAFIHLCLFRCWWAAFKFWLYRLMHWIKEPART